MNQLIADNRVQTLRAYLLNALQAGYDEREALHVTHRLFEAFNGWSRTDVVMRASERLGESELLKYHFALKRLVKGEPLQYVLGSTRFMDMQLEVNSHVLIPRPETEELVRLIVDRNTLTEPHILDIGTGSGCIALGLKKYIPQAKVTALDVSEGALQVALANANSNNLSIEFLQLNILNEIPQGKFNIIVSNPPYIHPSEADYMSTRVTDHEPSIALFTPDDDPLIFYRRLMELTAHVLVDKGCAYCEIHESKAGELVGLAEHYPIHSVEIHNDMQGKNRIITWKNK
ncbi:MAG: peptide chain release factor N(5)-glutamine methyltransferase [Flavobacteriales bacterium]